MPSCTNTHMTHAKAFTHKEKPCGVLCVYKIIRILSEFHRNNKRKLGNKVNAMAKETKKMMSVTSFFHVGVQNASAL